MMNRCMVVVLAIAACDQGTGQDVGVQTDTIVRPLAGDHPQIFGTPQHAGVAGTEQVGLRVVEQIQQDSDVAARLNTSGFLQVHEPPPLVKGNFVVIPTTQGFTEPTDFFQKSTTRYGLKVSRWVPAVTIPSAVLTPVWDTITDAVLVDQAFCGFGCQTNGYEALYGPAISNGSVYSPGKSGQLVRYDINTGKQQAVVDPLVGTGFSNDAVTTVSSALTVTSPDTGDVLYTVTAWAAGTVNRGVQPRASWLVRVHPDNTSEAIEWHRIATADLGIPQFPGGLCSYAFGTAGTPGPTDSTSRPPQFQCGTQRPGLNVAPSIDPNGDVIVVSYANNQWAAAFLIRLDGRTLLPKVASDTRGHALHGCGVRLTDESDVCPIAISCATITDGGTTHHGFDPCLNEPKSVFGPDLDSNHVTVAPNGDVSWGSYDGGFVYGGDYDARGFGMTFRRSGKFRANNGEFFWDVTAGVRTDPTSTEGFVYVHPRQLYSEFATDPLGIAIYDPGWNLLSKGVTPRDPNTDPNVTPVDFLAAQPLFDTTGSYYAPNSDGHLYKFGATGQIQEVVDLSDGHGGLNAISAVEGYGARDQLGRIYWSFGGFVYIIQGGGPQIAKSTMIATPAQTARLRAGKQASIAAAHNVKTPEPPELTR